jgi:hypothetical protein
MTISSGPTSRINCIARMFLITLLPFNYQKCHWIAGFLSILAYMTVTVGVPKKWGKEMLGRTNDSVQSTEDRGIQHL